MMWRFLKLRGNFPISIPDPNPVQKVSFMIRNGGPGRNLGVSLPMGPGIPEKE
jgi:hypothetical protein